MYHGYTYYTKTLVVESFIKKNLESYFFQIKDIVFISRGGTDIWGLYQEFIVISKGGSVKRVVFWENDLELHVTDMVRDTNTRRVIEL